MLSMLKRSTGTLNVLNKVAVQRGYASATTPSALVLLEHRGSHLVPATLNAVTAARKLGGKVTGLVVSGSESDSKGAVEQAQK